MFERGRDLQSMKNVVSVSCYVKLRKQTWQEYIHSLEKVKLKQFKWGISHHY